MPAVEIVVEAYVYGLGDIPDTVEVEMIDRLAGIGEIFVQYGECRGANLVSDSEPPADGCRERCLAGPHRSEKGYDIVAGGLLKKLPGRLIDAVKVFDYDSVPHICRDFSDVSPFCKWRKGRSRCRTSRHRRPRSRTETALCPQVQDIS